MGFGETHYRWREDVAELVKHFEGRFNTKANTYEDHPTGMGLDAVSVDFWSPQGRGWPISRRTGNHIFRALRNRSRHPRVRWIIWKGYVYPAGGDRYRYQDAQDQHDDHLHVTFW